SGKTIFPSLTPSSAIRAAAPVPSTIDAPRNRRSSMAQRYQIRFFPTTRGGLMKTILLLAFSLAAGNALAQSGFPPPPPKVSPAAGVIDMHVHSHPDVFGRNMDDIDVAQLAKARGMRGILLKNHVSETASRAALVMKVVPGIEVFGGIVLNRAVGGINPDAVEWMHRVYGGRGK